jgi:hypothetical protein
MFLGCLVARARKFLKARRMDWMAPLGWKDGENGSAGRALPSNRYTGPTFLT